MPSFKSTAPTSSFADRFRHGLKLVVSHRGVNVYARQLNQNAQYFLMSGGLILHVGKRKHVMRKFREYRPDYYVQQAIAQNGLKALAN